MTMSIENENFIFNKILLRMVGLWPYHRSILVDIHLIVFFNIVVSFIIFQLTTFITTKYTFDLAVKIFSFSLFCSIFLIKYTSFCINGHTVRYFMENLQYVCNDLRDKEESAIFKNCGKDVKQYTTLIFLFTLWNLIHVLLLPTYIYVMGIILSTNTSHTNVMQVMHTLLYVTEYFVDQEKYFYPILFHMDAAVCIGGIALIATGTFLVGITKHVCGMFKIASYRIEKAMAIPFQTVHLSNTLFIHKKIVLAVDIHRKGMELLQIFLMNFAGSFFILILVGVICLSLNLYGLFYAVMLKRSLADILAHFACVTVILLYMILGNYAGQEITDYHTYIFNNVYNAKWYITPLYIQKIIVFLLQKGTIKYHLIVGGGLFIASIESAGMLMSTSISYFTVLYSMWQSPHDITT